ncbi:hypothetical protein C1H46_041980 [Malus baccata]|uniref:Uncharacterized protein n=1 Tax=Malus baccata TaxID=106549 RepID=A0A540KE36_MALBA|nr:hypothetical protein C1H46_041980 [Malus baccata]
MEMNFPILVSSKSLSHCSHWSVHGGMDRSLQYARLSRMFHTSWWVAEIG